MAQSIASSPPTTLSPKDPLFFTKVIDQKRFRLASGQLKSSQRHQITAIQAMITEYHVQPVGTENPQLLRNIVQAKQLLSAISIPTGAQVLGAEFLHAQGWSKEAVAKTRARARARARSSTLTLSFRPKTPTLTLDQTRTLLQFVQSSPSTRRMPISQIHAALGLDCSERTITVALEKAGYKSQLAINRPEIDEKSRQLRLNFALKHVNWTVEEWASVLFYDEMQVHLTEQPQEVLVTRKLDEIAHPDCVNIEPVSPADCKNTNVYFAHLSGLAGVGPLLSYTRHSNGPLDPENWYRTIFPGFANCYKSHPLGARFAMSPDLPAHSRLTIKGAIQASHKSIVHLPPASRDLNPITEIFGTIKANLKADRANSLFGDVADYRIDDVVRDTWEGISKEHVSKLIASMPKRCQAVIDADGWYTHF
ncbi:unnamed protein product [Fusarium equiseti]|uniref:Transposase Tc1-like domain-containing protein n=1 Tax=Fusarium equiseti TaxID=61235 RepID=A0A8J2IJM8_FUSEQ|nr:unnamed protein product [Fusarium equiseti]